MFEDFIIDDWFDAGWLLLAFMFLVTAYEFLLDGTSHPPVETQRVNWQQHRDCLVSCGHFHCTYCMFPESLDKLTIMLHVALSANVTRAYARSQAGPIIPEI